MTIAITGTQVTFNDNSVQTTAGATFGTVWTDRTSQRSAGVTYTNSTGRSLAVAVSCWASGGAGYFYVSGLNVFLGLGRSTYFNTLPLFVIVPPGATYGGTSGIDYIGAWFELL